MKKVLFHREYLGFTGGHLKVWDYFQHFLAHPHFDPYIYLSPNSIVGDHNIWLGDELGDRRVQRYAPNDFDLLFAAGTDWRAIPAECALPVINLVQHVRHAEPQSELYSYLQRPALRICVSKEVEHSLRSTQQMNGPCYTIDNGLDTRTWPLARPGGGSGVVIDGIKNPRLANELAERLRVTDNPVQCIVERLPRPAYLAALSQSRVAICLPAPSEGFYLPAIEAALSGCLTVCPRVPGNSVCFDNPLVESCNYEREAILETAMKWLTSPMEAQQAALDEAYCALRAYFSLQRERDDLYAVLSKENMA